MMRVSIDIETSSFRRLPLFCLTLTLQAMPIRIRYCFKSIPMVCKIISRSRKPQADVVIIKKIKAFTITSGADRKH